MTELQARKWNWICDTLEEQRRNLEEQRRLELRRQIIARIDNYLAARSSPMQGLGHVFVEQAERFDIDPRLSVAIAEGESFCGKCCFAPYNAWGMLAYGNCGSWENGIRLNVELLHKNWGSPKTAYDCPGYCVPDHPWMENVDGVRRAI
ncbi:MAG: hypothetical protein WC194_07125 [Mesotoga sp.]|uniref:hypothetical protein n=1 Tax=Mesotoga sp. TaxID=2053577 RepID=UPI0035621CA8